jgi:hypothetical protein
MIYFLSNIIQQGRQTEVGYCHLKYTNYCGYNCKECYVPDLHYGIHTWSKAWNFWLTVVHETMDKSDTELIFKMKMISTWK